MLVPKWMYKDHYYDDNYNDTYGWYTSADVNGTTKSETIYTVSSAEGLAYIAQQVNTGELENVTIELSADIDLKGKVWTPIGITGHPFNGTFDGKGHTISNMSVVGNTYNGLFGVTNGATIQDLLIKDAQVASSGSNDYTAILVGYAKGTLEIEKVAIEDAHICAGNSSVAGMVGFLYNCTLKVNNAYVVIAVNGERVVYGGFSFVVNKGVGTNTITINNMYGANIGLKSTSYEIVSQGQTLGSQTHPYYISNCGEITIDKTYVVWEDSKSYSSPIPQSGITKFKSLNELRTETDELFKDKDNKTLWGTTWTRQYSTGDPTKTKNYGLPILSFAQEYWIDEGKTTSAVTESGNTYTITSASQLAWVAYQVNEKNNDFSGKTIQVTKDIDLAGKIWTPIGITNEPFKGSFELKEGFTISNMTCYGAYSTNRGKMTDSTTSYSEGYDPTYGGLFGLVEDSPSMKIEGNITNFVVSKVQYGAPFIAKYNVSSSTSAPTISVASIGSSSDDSLKDTVSASSYAGGVVGSITGTESVKVNVVAQVKNVSVVANWHAGGVVGCAKYATIYNSSVDGATYKKDGNVDESAESNINILSVNGNVGGIAGYVTESTIFNCWANKFSLNTTNNYGDIGGIVGYIGSTNLSALQVTAMTAKVNGCLGGIVGSSTNSTIQNATVGGSWSKYDNKIMHSKDGQYYGGVVGYMYKTNLSEVTVLGNMSVGSLSNYKSSGLVVGYIDTPKDYSDNSKYIVDNIYLNINYNESIGGGNYLDVYKTYIFGFGNQDTNKYPGLFDYTMFSMKNKYGEYVNCITYGDCTYSSAWKYNSYEFTNSDGLRGQMSFYSLKSASGGLYSKFCMTNANNLQYMLDNVETVDGHVVITPYKLDSVNVSTNAGMEYLAEWWTYRHKLSSNDTTIYIIDDIQDYSADSIGNEKFPFVGSIYGRSQNNINDQVRTLTFKNIYSIYGIVRYATKINASNITLAQSDKKSQGYGISGSDYVGGLVGRIVGSTEMIMENITSYITVKGRDYVGGIIGAVRLTSGGSLTMTNCNSLTYVNSDGYTINNVADKSSVKGRSYVGGIIGAVNDSVSTGKVTIQGTSSKNAVVQKDIEATGSRVGSVVGDGKYVTIKYYDIKPLKYKQDLLVDEADWLITVRKSGETTSTEYFGGVAGYIENSTIDNVTLDGISVSASIYNKATGLATDTNKPNCVGGAVGYATASTIQNVTVKNDAGNTSFKIAGKYYVGGLVGSASNVYNNAGKFENSVTLENNTVSNAKVEGFGSIGGLVGRLSNSKVADNYLYSITVKFNNISKNTVSACTISLQQTTEAEISEHDYVGGLIGEIKTDSYYTGRIVCADCGAPVTVNKNGNVTISSHYVSCPTFGSSSELEQKTPSLTMTNSGDNVNTVESSTLIYTKNVDMDEGWFGNYKTTNSNWDNRLSTNRWDNTIPKSRQVVSFSDAKQMAMGNYAFRLDGTNYKNWQPPTYKGYGRNFWYENVYTYNTWFGPSSGTSQAFSDLEDITTSNLGVQNCVYLSTFGTTSGITLYSGSGESSRTLPDLNTNYGVQSFFNSARGYNPNNMPNVGTLYGTNNITDNVSVTENVNIKKSSTGGKVLKDRLTHWAYIAMQDNDGLNRYGLLIIEWSYYIDSDQRKPSKYDFISDVQKEFISEANQRIEVKFRYDVKVDESSSNRLNDSYSTFTINWYSADQVSYPLRSLKDLFWESYNSSTGKPQEGRTNKGLINEFIMAVYDKDTSNKSLYCGNTWKVIKYDGSESECTLVNSDFGKIEQTGGYCIYANVNKSYYHRLPNNDSSYQKYTPDVYYYGYAFGKEERIIKQKTVMNNK